jgi:hypothetical protein
VRDDGSTVAAHPNVFGLDSTVQIPAAPVLLQEAVERGEEIGHGSGSVADALMGGQPGRCASCAAGMGLNSIGLTTNPEGT